MEVYITYVFEMEVKENIISIILINIIRVSLGTIMNQLRLKIVVIDIQIHLKQILTHVMCISVKLAKKSGMGNRTNRVNRRERIGIHTILHELNTMFTRNMTIINIKRNHV